MAAGGALTTAVLTGRGKPAGRALYRTGAVGGLLGNARIDLMSDGTLTTMQSARCLELARRTKTFVVARQRAPLICLFRLVGVAHDRVKHISGGAALCRVVTRCDKGPPINLLANFLHVIQETPVAVVFTAPIRGVAVAIAVIMLSAGGVEVDNATAAPAITLCNTPHI